MACRRVTGTTESRLIEAIQQLAPEDIKEATGKTADYFYKCSNPNNKQSLHHDDAKRLDLKLASIGKQPLFYISYQEAMQTCSTYAEPDDCFMQLIKEIGELALVLKLNGPRDEKIKEAQDVLDHALYTLNSIKESA